MSNQFIISCITTQNNTSVELKYNSYYAISSGGSTGFPFVLIAKCLSKIIWNKFMNLTRCKACGKEITFLRTRNGKLMPVDWESLNGKEKDDLVNDNVRLFDLTKHKSHFSTCPEADKFRKQKAVKQETSQP